MNQKRILHVGIESFIVPSSVSDARIATAIGVLRRLRPCDHYGKERNGEAMQIEYRCEGTKRENAKKQSE